MQPEHCVLLVREVYAYLFNDDRIVFESLDKYHLARIHATCNAYSPLRREMYSDLGQRENLNVNPFKKYYQSATNSKQKDL